MSSREPTKEGLLQFARDQADIDAGYEFGRELTAEELNTLEVVFSPDYPLLSAVYAIGFSTDGKFFVYKNRYEEKILQGGWELQQKSLAKPVEGMSQIEQQKDEVLRQLWGVLTPFSPRFADWLEILEYWKQKPSLGIMLGFGLGLVALELFGSR